MPEPLLSVHALDAHYGDFQALFGVSISVAHGQAIAVIGANGAGKSTLLKSIAGLMRSRRDAIVFEGVPIGELPAHAVARRGIALVPEGRRLFPSLTVEENLLIGGQGGRSGPWSLARIYELFPVLAERIRQPAGTLSGGEQQMLAIARCLMGAPQLIMFDEPSLGLAPAIVHRLLDTIRDLNRDGVTCLLVEQNVALSLKLASRAYVLENGRVSLTGAGDELLADDRVRSAYLGL